MELSFLSDFAGCPPSEKVFRHVRVRIAAPAREGERRPLAFALVLDRSSSMDGERFRMAKSAAGLLLERLDLGL